MPFHPGLKRSAISALICLHCTWAAAHTVWLAGDPEHAGWHVLRFGGHAGKLEPLDPAKLGEVAGYDRQGQIVPLERQGEGVLVRLRLPESVSLVSVSYDNGFWSTGADGRSVNRPMNEVPGATRGVWARKYHKYIAHWDASVTRTIGQAFELVPLEAKQPVAGQTMRLRVLIDGQPAEGIRFGNSEAGELAASDAEGVATVPVRPGANTLWAGRRTPMTDDVRATELSIEYILGFDAR
ncbi:MAG: DUF4198 domain-containing protein [Rhodocyclaceae bacterium]